MTFESFVIVELCIIAIIFIFEFMRGKHKNKSQKIPEGNFDGRIIINMADPDRDTFRLEYDGSIAEIPIKDHIVLQVIRE